jgi:hypothetical protein
MSVTVEMLEALAQEMGLTNTGAGTLSPGARGTFEIKTPDTALSVVELLTHSLDLTWLDKKVRFTLPNPLPPPLNTALSTPGNVIQQVLKIPLLQRVVDLVRPGTSGLLGQVQGTWKMPVDKPVSVSFEVKWVVKDAAGTVMAEGNAYLAPDGLTSPHASFVFKPPVVSDEDGAFAPVRYDINASVKLSGGGLSTGWIDLPSVPILVAPLRVPTVLALFVNRNFQDQAADEQGAVLLMFPENSNLRALQPLINALNAISSGLAPLTTFAEFASLVGALPDVTGGLTGATHVVPAVQDDISNLNDWTLIQRSIFENDTEAEDEISSLIFIGAAGKRVRCYNARNFDTGEGEIDVSAGSECYVLIRDLSGKHPATEPANRSNVPVEPPGGLLKPDSFNDAFSSVRFG